MLKNRFIIRDIQGWENSAPETLSPFTEIEESTKSLMEKNVESIQEKISMWKKRLKMEFEELKKHSEEILKAYKKNNSVTATKIEINKENLLKNAIYNFQFQCHSIEKQIEYYFEEIKDYNKEEIKNFKGYLEYFKIKLLEFKEEVFEEFSLVNHL